MRYFVVETNGVHALIFHPDGAGDPSMLGTRPSQICVLTPNLLSGYVDVV